MNASQTYTRLISLRDQGGQNILERIQLAMKLLGDKSWVEDISGGGGDESSAMDRIKEAAFGDCALTLVQLMDLVREVPDAKTWRANKYNLRAMYAESVMRKRADRLVHAGPPREKMSDLRDRIAALTIENDQLRGQVRDLQKEVRLLRKQQKQTA